MKRVRKELVGHLLEYDYLIDKASKIILGLVFLLTIIIIPDWTRTLYNYSINPYTYGIQYIGLSILITVLLLLAALTAFIIPHLSPTFRPTGFRRTRDERMLSIYLTLTSTLLSIVILGYILLGYYG
ncbi:MAG: hypothetical protein J7L82_06790 [Staphylothermus sp.]|nr:hypothetical protein [Staphylothermus sp.]